MEIKFKYRCLVETNYNSLTLLSNAEEMITFGGKTGNTVLRHLQTAYNMLWESDK